MPLGAHELLQNQSCLYIQIIIKGKSLFADWAKKADWKMGGARESGAEPIAPRPAFTPVYAFLARRQMKIMTLHPFLSTHDASVRFYA